MEKPLFRFTVGPCVRQGLEILEESLIRTIDVIGSKTFDWMICYNGLNKSEKDFLTSITKGTNIELYHQDWSDSPISDHMRFARLPNGQMQINGKEAGGTLWKVCPPRLRINAHEIIMDNDIVMMKKLPQIDEFLSSSERCLVLEEPIRFYGIYDKLFGEKEFLNSGIMGLPPGYDFGRDIAKTWESQGKHMSHSHADEQGLLMFTLKKHGMTVKPNIRIPKTVVLELLAQDNRLKGTEHAIHFTQANRSPNHQAWIKYLEITRNNVGMM